MAAFTDRASPIPLPERLIARGVRNVSLGRIVVDEAGDDQMGIAAARRVYGSAVETAENLWNAAKAGDQPDPGRRAQDHRRPGALVTQDRTSLMALTALKKYDNYTFTHMVNVAALSMAQARALNIDGPLLREFGFAALMHDIGKVNTPLEVLNKPGKLTNDEFDVMKRHVVDGAHILRRTPEMPALAPIVAFEHHLQTGSQRLSGEHRQPEAEPLHDDRRRSPTCSTPCAATVRIAKGMATVRIRSIMGEQGNPAFNQTLLKRFVNLMGLFPVGNLVRLGKGEIARGDRRASERSVPAAGENHRGSPRRRCSKRRCSPTPGSATRAASISYAVVEAVDPESSDIDPLKYL